MHSRLCQFTSEVFYDGKLTCMEGEGLENQEILGDLPPTGTGLQILAVSHEGNTNASPEEASAVAHLIRDLVGRQWQDRLGDLFPLSPAHILVLTPYNAQIRAIQDALAETGCPDGVRVGTVDKF